MAILDDQLRFSQRAPDHAVNLCWLDIPSLNPADNLSLIEAARFIGENLDLVWTESLAPGVTGQTITTSSSISGLVYLTTYNAAPAASGAIASGAAFYQVWRQATAGAAPSGFLIENFTHEIRVVPPVRNDTDVWRLRLQDGVIRRHHTLRKSDTSWLSRVFSPGDDLVVFYSLPDAGLIPYTLNDISRRDARVVEVSGVIAAVTDAHTLALPDLDLYQINQVSVNGSALILGPSGVISLSSPPPLGVFTAWDPLNGTLSLSRTLDFSDEVVVSYQYREYLLTYEGYRDSGNLYHDLDLNPSPGHTYDGGRPTSELINNPIYLYLLPAAAYKVADALGNLTQERRIYTAERWTSATLRWERVTPGATSPCTKPSYFGSSYFGQGRFVSDGTVEGLTAASPTATTLANFPSALILAKLYVTSSAQIENLKVIDTRVRGGGLPVGTNPLDSRLPGATRTEIATYWDVAGWDGQPVPLAGVLIVELPGDLLTGSNGYQQFSQEELENLVNAHVAAGVRTVIRYV